MKKKLTIGMLLLAIVMVFGTVTSCSDDDKEMAPDVFQGYIERIYVEPEANITIPKYSCYIVVIKAPSNPDKKMPVKDDTLRVSLDDSGDLNLKENRKVSFRILSATCMPIYLDMLKPGSDYWEGEIEILKIY